MAWYECIVVQFWLGLTAHSIWLFYMVAGCVLVKWWSCMQLGVIRWCVTSCSSIAGRLYLVHGLPAIFHGLCINSTFVMALHFSLRFILSCLCIRITCDHAWFWLGQCWFASLLQFLTCVQDWLWCIAARSSRRSWLVGWTNRVTIGLHHEATSKLVNQISTWNMRIMVRIWIRRFRVLG